MTIDVRKPVSNRRHAPQRFVSFVDILGFKQLVQDAKTDISIAYRIEAAVDDALLWVQNCKPHPTGSYAWKLRTFSDCISFSQPETPLGLYNMFEAVAYLVRRMIVGELPVRGAIVLDEHLQFRLTMPSSALVSAYSLEQTAIYPRITLSSDLITYITKNTEDDLSVELSEYVVFDENGDAFLNHLVCDEDDDVHRALKFLKIERDYLSSIIFDDCLPRQVLEKYLWLAAFHDWCVRSTNWIDTEEEMVMDGDLLVCLEPSENKFTSLWHIMAIVTNLTDNKKKINWSKLRSPDSWPFNSDWSEWTKKAKNAKHRKIFYGHRWCNDALKSHAFSLEGE